jgi:hypothetical protein
MFLYAVGAQPQNERATAMKPWSTDCYIQRSGMNGNIAGKQYPLPQVSLILLSTGPT